MKNCPSCSKMKPRRDFYADGRYHPNCIECRGEPEKKEYVKRRHSQDTSKLVGLATWGSVSQREWISSVNDVLDK